MAAFPQIILIAIDTCKLHGLGKDEDVSKDIWSVGHLTDGMIQRAMDAIESTSGDKNTVVEIIRKGYNFKDSQIRPVSVKVGNGKKAKPKKEEK